uniref:2Fe-2S ferredoxin-type domain-containing protein n=1 Tax=Erythrolobus australicus TaxID=1077150 RepID=A0A7S1TKT3_9RHOD
MARTRAAARRGALDMKAYTVEVVIGKKTQKLSVEEDQNILEAIEEAGIEGVDSSCRAGVCMTCSARIVSGKVEQGDAALADEAAREGFILTCSAMPRSDCKIELNQFEDAYEMQYGKYEEVNQGRTDDSLFGRMFGKK